MRRHDRLARVLARALRRAPRRGVRAACPARARSPRSTPTSSGSDDCPASPTTRSRRRTGESPTEIVAGFLEAMKAKPSRTSVAREFLTAERPADAGRRSSRSSPTTSSATAAGEPTVAAADDGHRGVRRPRRLAAHPDHAAASDFELTSEDGEWRIDELPDALIVPESWFDERFRRVSLYFFDPTAQILVPEPVFVPAGDQFASSLVGGLLDDPAAGRRGVTPHVRPAGLHLGLSVPISLGGRRRGRAGGRPGRRRRGRRPSGCSRS